VSVFRPQFTKPLPKGATVSGSGDKRVARWRDGKGRARSAPVTDGTDGVLRVVLEAGVYMARYRDQDGKLHQISTGCRSRDTAERVLREHERKVELVRSGIMTVAEQKVARHVTDAIEPQLVEYLEQLSIKATPWHIYTLRQKFKRLVRDCKLTVLADLQAGVVNAWLVEQRRKGLGNRTMNTYRAALHSFAEWCVRNGRLPANPIGHVSSAAENENQRRRRRAFTEDELRRLLEAARLRPVAEHGRAVEKTAHDPARPKRANWRRATLSHDTLQSAYAHGRDVLSKHPKLLAELEDLGRQRQLIYQTLVQTGLRLGELESITIGQVRLDETPPHILLHVADAKNRRESKILLNDELTGALREHIAKRGRSHSREKLFTFPEELSKVLNRDLQAASIPKRDELDRVVDVHALRHTFCTYLIKAGVSLRTAQAAMRHSTPALTANIYTDPAQLDLQAAVNALPSLAMKPASDQAGQGGTVSGKTPSNPSPSARSESLKEDRQLVRVLALAPVQPRHFPSFPVKTPPPGEGTEIDSSKEENALNGLKLADFPPNTGEKRWCARRGSNPQPSASEADALSN
jgi:integrase